jgi:hypothetical protein
VGADGVGGCWCDPGFAPDGAGGCADDPADTREVACADAACGEGATCMATGDAVTCRCAAGERVVIGLDARGALGPVCQAPANPGTACGPDRCGPAGECVIGQGAFCLCREGTHVAERTGSDGREHPFCVLPDGTIPVADGGATPLPVAGGSCRGTRAAPGALGPLVAAGLLAGLARRRRSRGP